MNSGNSLTQKVHEIEGFTYQKNDSSQRRLFDVIIDDMEIFEGVDENGGKYEYIYLLDNKKEPYKMELIPLEIHKQQAEKLTKLDQSTITGQVETYKVILNNYIDMIPFLPTKKLRKTFGIKNNQYFSNYHYFKCKLTRFIGIIHLLKRAKESFTFLDSDILKEIDNFILFHREVLKVKGYRDGGSGQDIPVTQEDIKKGNDILRKVIAYLETLQQEKDKTVE